MSQLVELFECVTCGQEVNTMEGLNCQRCCAVRDALPSNGDASPLQLDVPPGEASPIGPIGKANAAKLAAALLRGFSWGATTDTHAYWQDVRKRLLRIAETGK